MITINARNVNDAYSQGHRLLLQEGVVRPSRYGETIEVDEPVATRYAQPTERVLFDPARDANPFFHLMEALWILGGRQDVAFLTRFNKRMAEFSDNGETFHAAYGHRLRRHFVATDQLTAAIELLKLDPMSRRVVCSVWDPKADLGTVSKDIPCNDTLKFETRRGVLDLIVFCRSNDMVWGAYGANVVQFSMLQEYVAAMVGVPVGAYEQVSCNFHAYTALRSDIWTPDAPDPYTRDLVAPFPLVGDPASWDGDLSAFLTLVDRVQTTEDDFWFSGGSQNQRNPFFPGVAEPMYYAWLQHKQGNTHLGIDALDACCVASDWARAGVEWLQRRIK